MKKKVLITIAVILVVLCIIGVIVFHTVFAREYVSLCFIHTSDEIGKQLGDITNSLGGNSSLNNIKIRYGESNINVSLGNKLSIETDGESNETIQELLFNYEYLKKFYDILNVTKKGSEVTSFDTNDVNCDVYTVKISKDDFAGLCAGAKTDKTYDYIFYKVKNIIENISKNLGITFSDDAANTILSGITPSKLNLADKLTDDIFVDLYIHDNCVCKLKTSIDFYGINMSNVILEITLSDGNKPLDYADIHFSCVVDGKKFYFDASEKGDYSDKNEMNLLLKTVINYDHICPFAAEIAFETDKDKYTVAGYYKSAESRKNIHGDGYLISEDDKLKIIYYSLPGNRLMDAVVK
ncbi:MAG: hypothetical protein Q8882_08335 [Bacillota bacterium]|nr:hypothetical protein [Bacillota bacterium]